MSAHTALAIPSKSRDEIARAYDAPPWWYDIRGFFILTFSYRGTLWEQIRLFGRNMGARHLEVAIGSGTLLAIILHWRRVLRRPLVRITGIDYAEPMLAGAIHRFADHPEITLQHRDVAALSCADATYDTANVANAMHCFPDVVGALREMHRVLKPGGTLAANVLLHPRGAGPLQRLAARINTWGMRKGILFRPYAQDEVDQLVADAGFAVEQAWISGNAYNLVLRKPAA